MSGLGRAWSGMLALPHQGGPAGGHSEGRTCPVCLRGGEGALHRSWRGTFDEGM